MFAQAAAAGQELAWVMNAGALAILGYHMIWGLPAMLRHMLAAQAEEREAFEKRVDRIVEELKLVRQSLGCKLPSDWQP